ncbi:MAG: hypothetical protein Kow0029_20200 [Candidatus Rifleibacteriota bacterium]
MLSILIIADIEGSTGCSCKKDSQLFNYGWAKACIELTRDLNAVIEALFNSGEVARIKVKDFHRTGFNIIPGLLDSRAELSQGYKTGPVQGIGECSGFDLLYMIGHHAASGKNGFLAHTLTSRFSEVLVNGQPLPEAELFAASVAKNGLKSAFFTGDSQACVQAKSRMPWLKTFTVEKPLKRDCKRLRKELAISAVKALYNENSKVFYPEEKCRVEIRFKSGEKEARKTATVWNLEHKEDKIFLDCENLNETYDRLIAIAYLTPFLAKHLEMSLRMFNLWGRIAHLWCRIKAIEISKNS